MADRYLDEAVAAAVFWRLVEHLRHRSDAQNVDLMGLAGFCRNCLGDWLHEASLRTDQPIDKESARELIYGMPYSEWKQQNQADASPEQIEKMQRSILRNNRPA